MSRWLGPDGIPCAMVDGCAVPTDDRQGALTYLQRNFERFYRGNRAPFGVNMHAVWLRPRCRLAAMLQFLESITKLDDVYVISVYQLIDWMRSPRPVNELKRFAPWRTSCNNRHLARVLSADMTTRSTLAKVTRRHEFRVGKKNRKGKRNDVAVASDDTDTVPRGGEGGRGVHRAGRRQSPFHPTGTRNTTNTMRRHFHQGFSAGGGATSGVVTSPRLCHCLVILGGYVVVK